NLTLRRGITSSKATSNWPRSEPSTKNIPLTQEMVSKDISSWPLGLLPYRCLRIFLGTRFTMQTSTFYKSISVFPSSQISSYNVLTVNEPQPKETLIIFYDGLFPQYPFTSPSMSHLMTFTTMLKPLLSMAGADISNVQQAT